MFFRLNKNITDTLESALKDALKAFTPLKEAQESNEGILHGIEQILLTIDLPPLDKQFKNASNMADNAITYTKLVDEQVNNSFNQVSSS